ncbi:MAG TPA: IS4 family transposase [Gemmatimonadaceae bacterium]
MASIASIVERFKQEPELYLTDRHILDACAAAGHAWRDRVLGPVLTVRLMVVQMLFGNVSCRRLRRLAELSVSVAAYAEARARLPIDVLGMILWRVNDEARQATQEFGRWLGHRVMLIDGSGLSMPDTPALQRAFGQPGRVREGCGFPVMHTLWLFDVATGLLIDYVTGRWSTHDLAHAAALHPMMEEGDVLVGDRAFCSFAHLALLFQRNLHAVVRAHQRLNVDFTPGRKARRERPKGQRQGAPGSRWIRRLGDDDQIVEWSKPGTRPAWMDEPTFDALPERLTVRELRYTVHQRGFRSRTVTLVTTLLDPRKYTKDDLAELYRGRWQIETNLRHLKQTMGLDVLRCKTVEGVKKELLAYAIAYNLVRLQMLDAARRQGVPPDRISFIDALDVLLHASPGRHDAWLQTYKLRPGRDEPRVIKRPKDRYRYLTRPRDELRQELGITHVAA